MVSSGRGAKKEYKVKLSSGRILGPIDLERVRLLILKNQITGSEIARLHPGTDWKDINAFSEIAQLLVAKAQGKLKGPGDETRSPYKPILGATQVLGSTQVLGPTKVLESQEPLPGAEGRVALPDRSYKPKITPKAPKSEPPPREPTRTVDKTSRVHFDEDEDATQVGNENSLTKFQRLESKFKSIFGGSKQIAVIDETVDEEEPAPSRLVFDYKSNHKTISNEETIVFQGARSGFPGSAKTRKVWPIVRTLFVVIAVGMAGYELFFPEEPDQGSMTRVQPVRPKLPTFQEGKADPARSQKLYEEAMKLYVLDTVEGYRKAGEKLLGAAGEDVSNVKALAMLASCYLNLIDSSNKDENYFAVISKLIEMSRAKAVDLPETVIADVEFYVTVNRAEAAQSRIVEYTKTHTNFPVEMFYYLAYVYYHRGDMDSSIRYLSQFPENKIHTPKVFYLRGQIAEKLNDTETALREYGKSVKFYPRHAKSYLRTADIKSKNSELRSAGPDLEFLMENPRLLAPKDLALADYLYGQFNELGQKWEVALGYVERAVRLDKDNHDYILEMYTLRGRAGENSNSIKKQARMYYFLGEGEKVLKLGNYQDALTQFLKARQENLESPIPLMKIGDMFYHLHDVSNARMNYQLAADRAPRSIEVWSKYIDALIQSYDWEEAKKAMDRFRTLPVSQSAIDKAAGDLYAKQGRHLEAQTLYRKAMARESIDSAVYIAYAKSLMATRNYKDAPFFFALALRFDPLNLDAVIGTAQAIAATDSIDRGISMLQDELQKAGGARAELFSAIAELQIQKGDWDDAQRSVDQAKTADPDVAEPWKLQAQIYMNKEGQMRGALDKALDAYKSYSDRNPSDPSGYLERYRVFTRKAEFEKAADELNRIYSIYPKYPNLHYYKGALYSVMGNHKAAVEEFKLELKNNEGSVNTLLAMGKEYLELNMPQDALSQFNRAMQLAPHSPEPKQLSGYANYLLKNYQGAIALYNAALALDPANPMIYKRLGVAYRSMGDNMGAHKAFMKYLEMEPDAPDRAQFQ